MRWFFLGVDVRHASVLHFKGCDSKTTREHLRFACYKGKGSGCKQFEPYNNRYYCIIKIDKHLFGFYRHYAQWKRWGQGAVLDRRRRLAGLCSWLGWFWYGQRWTGDVIASNCAWIRYYQASGLDVQRKEGIQVAAATSGRKNIWNFYVLKKRAQGFIGLLIWNFEKDRQQLIF